MSPTSLECRDFGGVKRESQRVCYGILTCHVTLNLTLHALRSCGFWDQAFSDNISFSGDPVVATPDVTEVCVGEEDEFVILATDGVWCGSMPPFRDKIDPS